MNNYFKLMNALKCISSIYPSKQEEYFGCSGLDQIIETNTAEKIIEVAKLYSNPKAGGIYINDNDGSKCMVVTVDKDWADYFELNQIVCRTPISSFKCDWTYTGTKIELEKFLE